MARGAELDALLPELESQALRDTRGDDAARYAAALRERNQIQDTLEQAILITELADDPRVVEIGDEVVVELEDGSRETYGIVHPLEAVMEPDWISCDSPLSRAVLGRCTDDEVAVEAPSGSYRVRIASRRRIL